MTVPTRRLHRNIYAVEVYSSDSPQPLRLSEAEACSRLLAYPALLSALQRLLPLVSPDADPTPAELGAVRREAQAAVAQALGQEVPHG